MKRKKLIGKLLLLTMSVLLVSNINMKAINNTNEKETEKNYDEDNTVVSTSIADNPVLSDISKIEINSKDEIPSKNSNKNIGKEEGKDNDNDGLSDGLEEIFGADPEKLDTDDDGLDDYLEVKMGLSPNSVDTDNNGINDIDEDIDKDGLVNGEEIKNGTSPTEEDTDKDGIKDSDEVNRFKTSPVKADTDGDNIYDGDERKLGLDPNKISTDGITNDNERKINQNLSEEGMSTILLENPKDFKVSINGQVSGCIDRDVFVSEYDITPIENVRGVKDGAIEISSKKEKMDELTLKFNYEEYKEADIDNLCICNYKDEEFKLLDTNIDKDNKILSSDITDEGIYLVVNKEEYEEIPVVLNEESYSFAKSEAAVNTDTDYDGIENSSDSNPTNNSFSGKLKTKFATSKVSYTMDYRNFFATNKQYNRNIAEISSLFSTVIYPGSTYNGLDISGFMALHGIKDITNYNLSTRYNDSDLSEIYIGHKNVTYNGVTKEIIVIVVRGTNGSIEEWTSNFDVGSTLEKSRFVDWKVTANHKGFDTAATRILKFLDEYENKSFIDKNASKTYWVTGHSRGASIANVLGARLDDGSKDVYAYTFASPATTTASNAEDTNAYPGIFNVLNKDDLIPYLPTKQWGFKHYGKSYKISIASNYEKEWETLTDIWDYDNDYFGMDDTVNALAGIMKTRNDAYVYTCKCHGDGSSNNITIRNYGMSKNSREEAIAKIPSNALSYCAITRYTGKWIAGWDFTVCQQPEYFMQLLAAFMANKINAYRFGVELNIADRYEKAKTGIIKSGIGGLAHPHYPESYYLLAKHI
ncbi:MAG: lipase family protein [Clostridium sp.]|nr:lipase family protein [Clostridium sp.]